MELFVLYLWLKLDVIQGLFTAGGFILGITTIGFLIARASIYSSAEVPSFWKKWKSTFKTILISGILMFVVAGLIPSKTDVAILVGTHYALKVTDTPEATKVMALLRKKANDMLDEELNETTKEKK